MKLFSANLTNTPNMPWWEKATLAVGYTYIGTKIGAVVRLYWNDHLDTKRLIEADRAYQNEQIARSHVSGHNLVEDRELTTVSGVPLDDLKYTGWEGLSVPNQRLN
jgi:hypothetical protein